MKLLCLSRLPQMGCRKESGVCTVQAAPLRPPRTILVFVQGLEAGTQKEWLWDTATSGSAHCHGFHLDHKSPGQEGAYFREELFTCDRVLSKEG